MGSAFAAAALARLLAHATALVAVAVSLRPAPAASDPVVDGRARRSTPIGIALRDAVEVSRPGPVLGDVADVSGGDPGELQRLSALPLGPAPRVGRVARLERETLARWIVARSGVEARRLAWSGATSVEVRRAATEVSGALLVERAEETLRETFEASGLRVEISPARPIAAVTVPAGEVEVIARPQAGGVTPSRRHVVPVEVRVDGACVRTVPVLLDAKAYGPAYVASTPVAAGPTPPAPAFAVREVEWTGRTALPVVVGGLDGLRLRRPVAAGEALTRAHVEPAPLVARGDRATVHVRAGAVEVESVVEVLQDGARGQLVRVRGAGATAAILARVSGPGSLEVQP